MLIGSSRPPGRKESEWKVQILVGFHCVCIGNAFRALARFTVLQSECALAQPGPGEVGQAPATLSPRVPMESIKVPGEPCVALTPAPWEQTRLQVRFSSLSSPNLQRAAQNGTMGELEAGDVRGVHTKKGQRMDLRGQRESSPRPPPTPHHSVRLSRAVNPGVRQKSPWGFVGPVTGSLCHPRAPCWIPYGQLGRGSARRDPHKTQIVSGFQTLYCCL